MVRSRYIAVVAAIMIAMSLTACDSTGRVTYIPEDEGGSYTAEDLTAILETAKIKKSTADVRTVDAPEVRQKALADLRRKGDAEAALADVLTTEFPPDAASVPAIVEACTYEGQPAFIVIEAWGDPDSTLSHRRVWVFSRSERALLAGQSLR